MAFDIAVDFREIWIDIAWFGQKQIINVYVIEWRTKSHATIQTLYLAGFGKTLIVQDDGAGGGQVVSGGAGPRQKDDLCLPTIISILFGLTVLRRDAPRDFRGGIPGPLNDRHERFQAALQMLRD